jgi:CDP-glucose 4,6-dehydratase
MNMNKMNCTVSPLETAYSGKRVWLSGHTGFKGGWMAAWLLDLGAEVYGFALEPLTTPTR